MATSKDNTDITGIWTQIDFAEIADDSRLWLLFKEKMRAAKQIKKPRKKVVVTESQSLF